MDLFMFFNPCVLSDIFFSLLFFQWSLQTAYICSDMCIFIGIVIFHPHFASNLIFFTLGTKNSYTQDLRDKNASIYTH